jgi:glycine dehydrogenase subunit 1
MLAAIGAKSIDDLFDEIPADLKIDSLDGVPEAMSEMQVSRLMRDRAAMDGAPSCFIGAGAYEHHIPQAVWDIATRGEYYSAYTPYQAEASQGTLQTIYEYQTMITELTGLDVSNASLYDGASGLAEAALMAVRSNRKAKSRNVLLAPGVNPTYAKVATAIAGSQGLTFEFLPMHTTSGNVDFDALDDTAEPVAVVIQQPSFLGTLEDVDRLTDWAHGRGAYVIGIANPTSLAVLKAPGHWGEAGADRRPLLRLHDLQNETRPADARPHNRPDDRPRRQARFHTDTAGARATYSALQGNVEHLHEPGFDGYCGDNLHVAAG